MEYVELCSGHWRHARFLSPPKCPAEIEVPPSLLVSVYRGLFTETLSGQNVKLTTHLHLVLRLSVILLFPAYFVHRVNFNVYFKVEGCSSLFLVYRCRL